MSDDVIAETWTAEVDNFVELTEFTEYNIISRSDLDRVARSAQRYSHFRVLHARVQEEIGLEKKFPTSKKLFNTNAVKYKRVFKLGRYVNDVLAKGGAQLQAVKDFLQLPSPMIKVKMNESVIDDLAKRGISVPWGKGMALDRLYVQPASPQVDLKVLGKGEEPSPLGSTMEVAGEPTRPADKPIDLDELPDGEHVVQPFVRLGMKEGDDTLVKQIAIKTFKVSKTANGLTWTWSDGSIVDSKYPNFVDTQLQPFVAEFKDRGVALSERVKCVLTMKPGYGNDTKVTFLRDLDESGKMEAVLCPDFVTLVEISPLSKPGQVASIPAVPQPPINPEEPEPPPVIENDPRPPSALPSFNLAYTIFMGDVSGSSARQRPAVSSLVYAPYYSHMPTLTLPPHQTPFRRLLTDVCCCQYLTIAVGNGDRMDKLRRGLCEVIERYSASDTPYAICTWDSRVFWPPMGQRWMRSADKGQMMEWAGGLTQERCNDMRFAIEQAVKTGPLRDSARHLVIMCDGDIRPFQVDAPNTNKDFSRFVPAHDSEASENTDDWESFRQTLPDNVRSTSFVAFSSSADARMQRMATIGRGNFYNY
jgi:hypothetical protein